MYETLSLPAKLSDTKRRVLELVHPSPTLEVWLTIMKNLAEALHFIHAKDIIHRDLKSDNVVLNTDNVVLNRPKQFLSYCQSFNYVN